MSEKKELTGAPQLPLLSFEEAVVSEQELGPPATPEEAVKQLEQDIELFKKVKQLALKLTGPEDWVEMGKVPYLMESGAQKVAIAFGVVLGKISVSSEWHEDDRGKYIVYTASGCAYSRKLNRYLEDIGMCSTRDKFFGMERDEHGNTVLKPLAQVDLTMVKRKAVSNLFNRLIKRMVGLMNVSWEMLDAAGIKPGAKVDFKSGAVSGQQPAHGNGVKEKAEAPPEAQSKKDVLDAEVKKELVKRVSGMIYTMAGKDKEAARTMLRSFTRREVDGQIVEVSDPSKLTCEEANRIYRDVARAYAQWKEASK